MKTKVCSLALQWVLCALLVAGCRGNSEDQSASKIDRQAPYDSASDWNTLTFTDHGRVFRLSIPKTWENRSEQARNTMSAWSQTRLVAFLQEAGGTGANITVQTMDLNAHPDVHSGLDYAKKVRASGKTRTIDEPAELTVGTAKGARYVYKMRLFITQYAISDYFVDERTLIMVTSITDPDEFKHDKPILLQIHDTFSYDVPQLP